jgi:hypothetical protein
LVGTLVDSAIAGNARAQSVVVDALTRIGDAEDSEAPSLTPDDREILDAYVGSELKRRAGETDAIPSSIERQVDRRRNTDEGQELRPVRRDRLQPGVTTVYAVLSPRRNSLFDGSSFCPGAASSTDIRRFSCQLLTDDENFPVIFPVSREFVGLSSPGNERQTGFSLIGSTDNPV